MRAIALAIRRIGTLWIAAAVVICAAALFAVWQFAIVPRLFWEWQTRMPGGQCQQLFVVFDGTGQRNQDGTWRDSNLLRLLVEQDPECRIYVSGIGAGESQLSQLAAAMFGIGSREARDFAYIQILQRANAHTRLFILGGSTGALSALMLAHTIDQAGLSPVTIAIDRRTERPYDMRIAGRGTPIRIAFLGLCDMTASWFSPMQSHFAHDLPSVDVPRSVDRAVHVLALDEHRPSFSPIHINSSATAREVWFAGTHADVCGGNGNEGLNVLARRYMRDQMTQWGLMTRRPEIEETPEPRKIVTQGQADDRDVFVVERYERSAALPLVHQSAEGVTRNRRLPMKHVAVNSDYKLFQP